MRSLAFLLLLAGCGHSTASIPPCNAWVVLWGTADATIHCPDPAASIPIFQRKPR